MAIYAETRAKRRREQARARGGANERERAKRQLHGAGSRAFVNHYIDAVILHCRVEIFLDNGAETMDFVDKKHIVLFKRR